MKIGSITAKNYRALEDLRVDFSANYCAISGHNNAGKLCLVRLITFLFSNDTRTRWSLGNSDVDFETDFTQWKKYKENIEIDFEIQLSTEDDRSLTAFIEKITSTKFDPNEPLRDCRRLQLLRSVRLQHSWDRMHDLNSGGFLAHRNLTESRYEIKVRSPKHVIRTDCQRHSQSHTEAVFS